MLVVVCYYDVILLLVFIEKFMLLEEGKNVFYVLVFVIKKEIKEVVEVIWVYEKKIVVVVNMIKIYGKVKCFCGMFGKCNDQKKVIVMFEDGKLFDLMGDF